MAKRKGKRNLKQRKEKNLVKLQDAKKICAEFVGIPYDKYSALELVICVSAKFNMTVRGDIHPHQQIKFLSNKIKREKNRKRDVVVKSTKKDFYSSRAWQILRYQAFEKYGNKCQCCGATPDDGLTMHVDHIKPKSTHPELALDLNNLQILCIDCNVGKINQWDTDWRA
jgi:5-methylcytosine-specific restriction endonuclease McrA